MNLAEARELRGEFSRRANAAKTRPEQRFFIQVLRQTHLYAPAREQIIAERQRLLAEKPIAGSIPPTQDPTTEAEIIHDSPIETDPLVDSSSFRDQISLFPNPSLEVHREHADTRITEYLDTPGEKKLREHQVDAFASLQTHVRSGKTAGSVILPPGAGKTHFAAELIKVLGLQTVVFSHSRDVLAQNGTTISTVCPNLSVSNFLGGQRDASGNVINTLYQSFPALSRDKKVNLDRVGLVIYDEADLSLGEERHKIHAQFPNALKIALTATPAYEQLNKYEEDGVITGNEEWVETFRNIIHEMPIEEALERGVIPPQDIHLVKTNIVIPNIRMVGDQLDQKQLARFINQQSRNALIVAMIAGLDHLPAGTVLREEDRVEIDKIHQKINGKRTVIHCMNVEHILAVEKLLRNAGISAEAFYGAMKRNRKEVLDEVKRGEIQVIIGDQLTGRGLDIPELEVGIHGAVTLSERELLQQIGRIFRHAPQIGKEKGISIQLIDRHITTKSRQPVIIPSLFLPDFVLRGRTARRSAQGTTEPKETKKRTSTSNITVEGSVDLEAYFEEVRLQDIIFNRFRNASLSEMNTIISDIYNRVMQQQTDDVSLYDVYTQIVGELPNRIPTDVNDRAIVALHSEKPEEKAVGMQVLMICNLKSVLAALEPFLTADRDVSNELLQHVLTDVATQITNFTDSKAINRRVNMLSRQSARRFVADHFGIPVGWVDQRIHLSVIKSVESLFSQYPSGIDEKSLDTVSEQIGQQYAIPKSTMKSYISQKNKQILVAAESPEPLDNVIREYTGKKVVDRVKELTKREQRVIFLRYSQEMTLEEIGQTMNITRGRVGQIEAKAFRKLRTRKYEYET